MTFRRRAVSMLIGVLALQLTLGAGGARCVVEVDDGARGLAGVVGDVDMTGIDTRDHTHPERADPCDECLPAPSDAPGDDHGCAALIVCVQLVPVLHMPVSIAPGVHRAALPITGPVLTALTRTTAPESPPPRA